MSEENITRITLDEILAKRARGEKSRTDWARGDAMTDEDIERAMRDDPDWQDLMDIDWSKAVMVSPQKKKAISDPAGRGYRRILPGVRQGIPDPHQRGAAPLHHRAEALEGLERKTPPEGGV